MVYQFINDNNKNIITSYLNNSLGLKYWSLLKACHFNSFKKTINLYGEIVPSHKLISFIFDSNIIRIEIDSNDNLRKIHTLTRDSIFNDIDLGDMKSYLIKFIRDRKIEEILL
jgi:hypothetical protein